MVWTLGLAVVTDRPAWLVPLLAGGMVAAMLTVGAIDGVVAGRPRLVCFHDEFAAIVVAIGLVALTGQPLLPTLDLAVPGLAIFLVFGRLGCLIASCCHGRPAVRGIRYGARHVTDGLAPEYVGVPLIPVAAFEAAVLAVLAVVTTCMNLAAATAGAAFATYVLGHVGVRFWLEFLRGDEDRPHLAGFSEAQWTAMAVTGGLVIAHFAGWSVLPNWLPLVAAAVMLAGVALVATRADLLRLHSPAHVRELTRIVRCAALARGGLITITTGLGVRVSAAQDGDESDAVRGHYAFSRGSPALALREANVLSRIVGAVQAGGTPPRTLVRSGNGVYHLMTGRAEPRG
jgi:hypothetical protein